MKKNLIALTLLGSLAGCDQTVALLPSTTIITGVVTGEEYDPSKGFYFNLEVYDELGPTQYYKVLQSGRLANEIINRGDGLSLRIPLEEVGREIITHAKLYGHF